ncbi:MAG TPA: DUF2269 family protein [Candidatus Aquilonibacter sp.]|nr:DUF2269 family protein [Candidatus Aquilonibacter sp.]
MLALKTLHIAAAVLWLGNFVVTGVWSIRAFLSGERSLERFATREILFTDAIFTLGFGSAVVASGLILASMEGVAALATRWTATALAVAVASGIVWLVLLLPLELRMHRLSATNQAGTLRRLFLIWNLAGWAVTLALFAVIYLMVAKPT